MPNIFKPSPNVIPVIPPMRGFRPGWGVGIVMISPVAVAMLGAIYSPVDIYPSAGNATIAIVLLPGCHRSGWIMPSSWGPVPAVTTAMTRPVRRTDISSPPRIVAIVTGPWLGCRCSIPGTRTAHRIFLVSIIALSPVTVVIPVLLAPRPRLSGM